MAQISNTQVHYIPGAPVGEYQVLARMCSMEECKFVIVKSYPNEKGEDANILAKEYAQVLDDFDSVRLVAINKATGGF